MSTTQTVQSAQTAPGCGAPEQTIALPAGIDLANQAVIQGVRGATLAEDRRD